MNRFMKTLLVLVLGAVGAFAQTQTTGQISGTVSDISGAVLPRTKITVTGKDTGLIRTTETNATGYYQIPLLQPGNYMVSVTVKGFQTVVRDGITVAVDHAVLVDFRLMPGSIDEKMTVTAQAPLIEPSNPNTTTTFNAQQLADLPNPGGDLSYVANLAPGAILNTTVGPTGGFRFSNGNVEFNGLAAVSNDFTIDGLDANDGFLNTNSTGASGLQLGLQAIQEVSVNTEAYSADQGRLGAAQINYVTKSGTNGFHGKAYELWNGSRLNAKNFFLNTDVSQRKQRSNVNQFGASLGGPIIKNKLFFFADLEGVRLVVPNTQSSTLPSPAYQQYVLQQLPLGGVDDLFGIPLPPQPGEVPFYQNLFQLMGDTSRGNPIPILGCPFDVGGGVPVIPGSGDGCGNTRRFSTSPVTSETLFTVKFDYLHDNRNGFWYRFQLNDGSNQQADPVNSIFDVLTAVSIRSGAAGWTHAFSPSLVNQFNPGITYRSAVSNVRDPERAHAAMPIAYFAAFPFTPIGASLVQTPLGQAATVWQIVDNLAWTRGRHSMTFGTNLRRSLFSIPSVSSVPAVGQAPSLGEFTYGATPGTSQFFPESSSDRISALSVDFYAMDTFRVTTKLTLSYGLRVAWDSNPVSQRSLLSRWNGSFETLSHDVNRPLNQDILANQGHLFSSAPPLQWEPRFAVAYEPMPNTVLRAGFGVFGEVLPGAEITNLESNAPSTNTFNAGFFSPLGGFGIIPGATNSAIDVAVAANEKFNQGFASGALSCASPQADPTTCLPPVAFNGYGATRRQRLPYSMQWNLAVQRQLRAGLALTLRYVGTRGVRGFYSDQPNMYQTACDGCFALLPFNAPPDPRFGVVSSTHFGASSSYHSLQAVAEKRMGHGLTLQANYTYSHCLDYVSNQGASFSSNVVSAPAPGQLKQAYGNCDYDVRHSLNGSYIYDLPFRSTRSWLNQAIGGWQLSGTMFLRGGLPISVVSSAGFPVFQNGFPTISANVVPGIDPYTRSAIAGVTPPGASQWLNPEAFQGVIDPSTAACFPTNDPLHCQNGNSRRNSLRGPSFRWFDLSIGKRFKVGENLVFRIDTQFFNLFNHPNLGIPPVFSPAGIPGQPFFGFGAITNTVSPLTGLLGAGLNGDSSARMIAIRGRIEF